MRKDVVVDFTTNITVNRGDTFSFRVTADPINSRYLDVTALDVRLFNGGRLVYLNSTSDRPVDPDSPKTFTFNYLAARSGSTSISPIIVTYKLTAGQRDSGLITKYYGPVAVQIGEIPTRNAMTRGLAGGTGVTIKMEKTANEFAIRPGEITKVSLKVSLDGSDEARQALGNVYLRDYPPDSLIAQGEVPCESGYIEFPVDISLTEQEFEYSVEALETYRGDLGTAVLMSGDEILAYTAGREITVTPEDYFIERAFSRSEVEVFSPLTVSIKARSDTEVKYIAIEDYFVPGSKVDEASLDRVVEDNEGTILSYDHDSDKVTFFIKSLGEVEFSYKVIPTIPGRLVAPPVLMFPMYSPDDPAQSDSHRLTVNPEGREWGLKYVMEGIGEDVEPEPDVEENEKCDPGKDPDVPGDIPVDILPPDGVGDGDPEPEIEDDDDDPEDDDPEDDDVDGAGEAVGEGKGLAVALMIIVILIALIAAMMVIKHRGKKGDGSVGPKDAPLPGDPEKAKRKVIRKKRVKRAAEGETGESAKEKGTHEEDRISVPSSNDP